jgi:hypothetical protein
MKAVRIHEYGGPEVLRYEEAPRPAIGEQEVLIRGQAAAVNPLDWKVRAGAFAATHPVAFCPSTSGSRPGARLEREPPYARQDCPASCLCPALIAHHSGQLRQAIA